MNIRTISLAAAALVIGAAPAFAFDPSAEYSTTTYTQPAAPAVERDNIRALGVPAQTSAIARPVMSQQPYAIDASAEHANASAWQPKGLDLNQR